MVFDISDLWRGKPFSLIPDKTDRSSQFTCHVHYSAPSVVLAKRRAGPLRLPLKDFRFDPANRHESGGP
jgi:hypothetical protein